MSHEPTSGHALVTSRAIRDIVRAATLGSYGVSGFASGPVEAILERLGLYQPGLRVTLGDRLTIELDLTMAYGIPVAEVARQVDSAVRYAISRTLDREVDRLTIHVNGLRVHPGGPPPNDAHRAGGA